MASRPLLENWNLMIQNQAVLKQNAQTLNQQKRAFNLFKKAKSPHLTSLILEEIQISQKTMRKLFHQLFLRLYNLHILNLEDREQESQEEKGQRVRIMELLMPWDEHFAIWREMNHHQKKKKKDSWRLLIMIQTMKASSRNFQIHLFLFKSTRVLQEHKQWIKIWFSMSRLTRLNLK